MGFAFRKLYPNVAQLAPSCCNLPYTCPCVPPCDPGIVIIEWCVCPGEPTSLYPCTSNPPKCDTFICYGVNYIENLPSLELCTPLNGVDCNCNQYVTTWCPFGCEDDDRTCCARNDCFPFPYGFGDIAQPVTRIIFNECEIPGAAPYTYKIENVNAVTGPFACAIVVDSGSPQTYEETVLGGYNTPSITGYIGDPTFTVDPTSQRYYKTPAAPAGRSIGTTAAYSPYCFKLHSTQSQLYGMENRVMFVSGRNVYRYAGVLSGDPVLASADPFWDEPGGSGIKQYETSIIEGGSPREFPLPDSVLQFPLWGQEQNSNLGILDSADCISPYDQCDNGNSPVCRGCACIRSNPSVPNEGHYLSNDYFNGGPNNTGYTAGYFSFSCFNPESYLDHAYTDGGTTKIRIAGAANRLGFGNVGTHQGEEWFFNCDPDNSACAGVAGATSHGMRLGVPTCSLWSLVNALYARVLYSVKNEWQIGLSESTFRNSNAPTGFKSFSDAVSALLSDDPSGETPGGTSKVQYHLARVSAALESDSLSFFALNPVESSAGDRFRFTFPSVFLWDPVKYPNAIGSEKWKHLYVVGNANVIYDSRSVAIFNPYQEDGLLHTNVRDQQYRSSVFYLNEVNHERGYVRENTNQARMFVFNGSGGPSANAEAPLINRRNNVMSKISLAEMPICFGITFPDDPTIGLSICSICNAFPRAVCPQNGADTTGLGYNNCEPVNNFTDNYLEGSIPRVYCSHLGGRIVEPNCLTASYQIQ
jgi:hypothetical protein